MKANKRQIEFHKPTIQLLDVVVMLDLMLYIVVNETLRVATPPTRESADLCLGDLSQPRCVSIGITTTRK